MLYAKMIDPCFFQSLSHCLTVIPGYCVIRSSYDHWLFLVLSRGEELKDHGLLQKSRSSGTENGIFIPISNL